MVADAIQVVHLTVDVDATTIVDADVTTAVAVADADVTTAAVKNAAGGNSGKTKIVVANAIHVVTNSEFKIWELSHHSCNWSRVNSFLLCFPCLLPCYLILFTT